MKPSFQHLGFDSAEGSFLSYVVRSKKFGFHWHYHPECEIAYVVNGYGTCLIGDHVSQFEQGDLLFIGSNLPHTLISDELFNRSGEVMEVIVIQFHPELFDTRTIEVEELTRLGLLIKESLRGLYFKANRIPKMLVELFHSSTKLLGFERYICLLKLLNELSTIEYRHLASILYQPNLSGSSEERILKVCAYIHGNFNGEISLYQLASMANMNESAFCRFFKKMTGKTAIEYINSLRLGMACRLLQNDHSKINEVAFDSGFNTIPYFNRYFKKMKNCSPSEYRKQYSIGRN